MTHKVSIIVPIYNVEKYLPRCIESILSQTFIDFECILVDDGSPDRCPEICDEYAKKDERIKVIHQENKGSAAARNAGLLIANGEFICFIDSDDFVEKDYLETFIREISTGEIDIAICNYFFEKKDEITVIKCNKDFETSLLENLISDNLKSYLWNKIFKVSIIQTNNIRFIDSINYMEDAIFCLQYFSNVKNAKFISKPLYHYIQRENSYINSEKSMKTAQDLFNVMSFYYNYLTEKQYLEKNQLRTIFFKRLLEIKIRLLITSSRKIQKKYSGIWPETIPFVDKAEIGKLSKIALKSKQKKMQQILLFFNSILLMLKGKISLRYYFR